MSQSVSGPAPAVLRSAETFRKPGVVSTLSPSAPVFVSAFSTPFPAAAAPVSTVSRSADASRSGGSVLISAATSVARTDDVRLSSAGLPASTAPHVTSALSLSELTDSTVASVTSPSSPRGASSSSSVSTAAPDCSDVSEFFQNLLENGRDRALLLRLETELIKFMKDSMYVFCPFPYLPSCNSPKFRIDVSLSLYVCWLLL